MTGYQESVNGSCIETMDGMEPIAVIGLSLRFPGDAEDAESFWNVLCNKGSTQTEIPKDRFNIDAFYHPNSDHGGTMMSRKGNFLKQNIAAFDAGFFAVAPNEANSMDPQQRILLEVVYESLENAGLSMEDVNSTKTSCFVGAFTREYESMMTRDEEKVSTYHATGIGMSMIANRVSWFYNLKGPSLTLDTACSSSLTALHLACQSLRNGESNMSILGGVNLIFNPDAMFPLTSMGFLSPDGQCYAFDHRANGYVRGEGFAAVVLQPLSAAIRDGHTIRSVIRATGINQDGRTPGITMPNSKAQEDLIRATYAAGKIDMAATRFFEAHGTGTAAGDPIEAGAIAGAFGKAQEQQGSSGPLYVGAVKSNIGHLEGTSGLAGLIKTILVLEKGLIPPNTAFEKPNPRIREDEWNIKFPQETTPWPQEGLRRASINSFGYGGSNAHAVLDDAFNYLNSRHLDGKHRTVASIKETGLVLSNGLKKAKTTTANSLRSRAFVWSFSDKEGASRLSATFPSYLRSLAEQVEDSDSILRDLAFTMAKKRGHLNWRTSVVASSLPNLADAIEKSIPPLVRANKAAKLGFVFSGQGVQWAGMGKELFSLSSVYRESIETADAYFRRLGSQWSLIEQLEADPSTSKINEPMVSQPACTALQVALVDLLRSWGLSPSRVIGHSSGEIAAAYCIGALDQESAWKVAYFRGVVTQKLSSSSKYPGGMLSAGLTEREAQARVKKLNKNGNGESLTIACVNSPSNVTISGDITAIDKLLADLESETVFARRLNVSVAYHSAHMEQVASEYASLLGNLHHLQNGLSSKDNGVMFSSVTSSHVTPEHLRQAQYWVQNLVSPVRFADALKSLCTETVNLSAESTRNQTKYKIRSDRTKVDDLVEVGPHPALRTPIRQTLSSDSVLRSIGYIPSLERGNSAAVSSVQLAGSLFARGHSVDLEKVNGDSGWFQTSSAPKMLTNLPSYSWNHSQKYWFESRLSRDYRFRKHARHDLLGAPVADWNPMEPRWRNCLRVSENPWMKDHKVSNSMLYPGAGFLVMAIEASRQMADQSRTITGFRIREAVFHSALTVPDDKDGIETMFYMRPHAHSTSLVSTVWYDFHVSSFSDRYGWKEHCRGLVSIEYATEPNVVDGHRVEDELAASYVKGMEQAILQCKDSVDPGQMYEYFETLGLQYGPNFRPIKKVLYGGNKAVCVAESPDIKKIMPGEYFHEHVIHPTLLDGILQFLFPALGDGGTHLPEVMVPAYIGELWVSSQNLKLTPGTQLTGYSDAHFNGPREAHGQAVVFAAGADTPCVILNGLRSNAITSSGIVSGDANNGAPDERRVTGYQMQWKPDIDFLTPDKTSEFNTDPLRENMAPVSSQIIQDLESLSFMYMHSALKQLTKDDIPLMQPHHQKYVAWMKHQLEGLKQGSHKHQMPDWKASLDDTVLRDSVAGGLETTCADGRVMARLGPQIVPILRQEVDPLELMLEDDLLSDLYQNGIGNEMLRPKIASFIDMLSFKNPEMNILEVGAGTGGTTVTIMKTLSRDGPSKLASYQYTDISAGFFEDARRTFGQWGDKMSFKMLDVEKDPLSQGFEEGKADLIVASNVLHATSNLKKTVRNVHKLLKPGGKLMILEICHPMQRNALSFGLLPGWWRSEEPFRQWGPTISQSEWDSLLRDSGFSGCDFALRDYENPSEQHISLLISTANAFPIEKATKQEELVIVTSSHPQSQLVSDIQSRFKNAGQNSIKVITLNELTSEVVAQKSCLFAADMASPVLLDIGDEEFVALQKLLLSARNVVWLTPGNSVSGSTPNAGLATGLGRVVRAERNGFTFVILQLPTPARGPDTPLSASSLDAIVRVFEETLTRDPGAVGESEYSVKDGVVHINRLLDAPPFNDLMIARHTAGKAKPQPFRGDSETNPRPLKLEIAAPGMLSTLRWVEDEVYTEPLAARDIEIEVKAVGLNFRDVMIAMGQLSAVVLGYECAGVVSKIGGSVTDFQPGDRVFCVAGGSFKTYYRDQARMFQKIPSSLGFEEAAALPLVYATAYYALEYLAHLRKGQSILIHAAAGGVGQAAIVLAKRVGAEIYATVGTAEKKAFLQREYDIAEDHIFYSRDLSFAQGIMKATSGCGVDVVLNSLSGEALRASWQCLASFGTFVELGRRDIEARSKLDLDVFIKNVTFTSVNCALMFDKNRPLACKVFAEVVDLAAKGEIMPAKGMTVYPYGQLEEAFRFLQSGRHIGKIILKPSKEDVVNVLPRLKEPANLDSNASYLVVGGLGGLGRSMIRRLVNLNARNLVLISRSGAKSSAAQSVVDELREEGVKVAIYACDVSDAVKLASVLDDASKTMPPIRGCIQSAMVLQDAMFESMSPEAFRAAVRPKAQGSWNLHSLLSKDLDFFIMLSSASGVTGTRGQANYAAGNTYQDALAHYRVGQGQHAIAIDLGLVLSVGYVAENHSQTADYLKGWGFMGIRENEFLTMIEYAIDPANAPSKSNICQVTAGIESLTLMRQKGLEEPYYFRDPLFSHLRAVSAAGSTEAGAESSHQVLTLLQEATSLEAATAIICEALISKVSKILSFSAEDIEPGRPLHAYGVDSLVAVVIRYWFFRELAADIAVFDILSSPSILALSSVGAEKSKYVNNEQWEAT